VPFEKLLSDDQAPTDPVRRIPRAAIWPAWPLIAARLPAGILDDVERVAARARSTHDKEMQDSAAALWDAAAKAIGAGFDAIAQQVGETQWLRDIAGAMRAHRQIAALRETLRGSGLGKPSEALAKEIAGQIGAALELGEDPAFAAAMVAAAHFRSPASIIGALVGEGLAAGEGTAVMRRLCEALGGDTDREIAAIQAPDRNVSPGAVVAGLDNLVDSLQAMQGFAKQAKDPVLKLKVQQAMLAARTATVDDMLPRMRNSVGSNLDRAVDELVGGDSVESSREVESNITALRRARPSAEFLGAGKELESTVSDLLTTVREKAAAASANESEDERMTRIMALARFFELLEGADAAAVFLDQWLQRKAA
jgi:hypothetical protein